KKIAALPGHRGSVNQVAFSPDGRLASASADTTVLVWDVQKQVRDGKGLDDKAAATLWDDLAADDPKVAYTAGCRAAATGATAVKSLQTKLKPANEVRTDKVPGWVRQLDSDVLADREQASRALAALGPSAEAVLRKEQEKAESVEVKARLGRILRGW